MNLGPIFIPAMLIRIVVSLVVILAFVLLNAGLVLVYLERKVAGFIQRRPGPYEVGPQGLLQPIVDGLKMLGKELHTPACGDKLLFWAAPVLALTPIPILFLPIPFSKHLVCLDSELGIVVILAFTGLNILSLCLAGWGSFNKWSLLGAVRAVSQAVAYEIPLLLTILSVVLMTGTLKLTAIAEAQGPWPWQWNWLVQPLGFAVFFVSMMAETNRAPFDLPEAESELTAGFHTEYSGLGFGLFFLSEYSSMIAGSAVAATLFLGGWQGPFLPGVVWFLIKIFAILLVMMWIRWTFPRVRFDQLLNISWRWLIPLALLNLVATALMVKL
jgi:NADH-quinone oxidoreductase subunit H